METCDDPKEVKMLGDHSFVQGIDGASSVHDLSAAGSVQNLIATSSSQKVDSKFDQLQMLENGEHLTRTGPQIVVVSSANHSSSLDIPFSQLRTMDGQPIDLDQLSIINSQPLQLNSMVEGSYGGLGEITIMGTLMASQNERENQINLVQTVSLGANVSEPEGEDGRVINTEQNYTFTPIQNVFNVMGIPQGTEQGDMFPTDVSCDSNLSPEEDVAAADEHGKIKIEEKDTTGNETRNVIKNVQLSWPESTSMRSSNIQLVIPEEIAALDSELEREDQLGMADKLDNPKYVSLLPSNIKCVKKYKTVDTAVSEGDTNTDMDDWTTDAVNKDKGSKQQIYSIVLDQLSNHQSAMVEIIEVCQSVSLSNSVQFEKLAKILMEKLKGLLEFFNLIRPVVEDCLGSLMKVDKSTQTDAEKTPMCSLNQPLYSSVSGRKIRQTERFQGFLDVENGISARSEEKTPYNRKKRKVPSFEQSVEVPSSTINTQQEPAPSLHTETQDGGKEGLALMTSQEKEGDEYLMNGKHQSGFDLSTDWAKHTTQTVETSKSEDDARKKRVFKTKKQYEAEAQFKFFCQNCSFKSKRESHFRKHLELHEKISDIFVCKLCGFKTIRQSTLRKHEISHSVNVIKCKVCSYVTDSETLLRRHMNLKHNNRKRHYKRDRNQTYSYRCSHCGQTLPSLSKYRLHLKMHNSDADTDEFAFHCDQCDYKTKRKEHINRHRMNHTNDRPHLCDTCGMTFKRSDTLSQHKQVHLEKMQRKLDFICQICNKAFRSKCHLGEHMAMHSNSRQYLCDVCGASFKTKSCQLKHVKNIHQNPRSFPCSMCEKRFNTNYALKRHERTHENDLKMMPTSTNVLVTQNFLTDVSAQGINQAELVQATDIIITPTIEEPYEQSNDVKLQQVLGENASAIMFLSSSLPNSWN